MICFNFEIVKKNYFASNYTFTLSEYYANLFFVIRDDKLCKLT